MKIRKWIIWLVVIIVAAFVSALLPSIWKYPFGFIIGQICFLILNFKKIMD
jgi:Mg2+/citrate symporter